MFIVLIISDLDFGAVMSKTSNLLLLYPLDVSDQDSAGLIIVHMIPV